MRSILLACLPLYVDTPLLMWLEQEQAVKGCLQPPFAGKAVLLWHRLVSIGTS